MPTWSTWTNAHYTVNRDIINNIDIGNLSDNKNGQSCDEHVDEAVECQQRARQGVSCGFLLLRNLRKEHLTKETNHVLNYQERTLDSAQQDPACYKKYDSLL